MWDKTVGATACGLSDLGSKIIVIHSKHVELGVWSSFIFNDIHRSLVSICPKKNPSQGLGYYWDLPSSFLFLAIKPQKKTQEPGMQSWYLWQFLPTDIHEFDSTSVHQSAAVTKMARFQLNGRPRRPCVRNSSNRLGKW